MNPTNLLEELVRLAECTLNDSSPPGSPSNMGDEMRLAELVCALDNWLRKGGSPPAQWRDAFDKMTE